MSYTYIILSVFQKISVPLQKLQKSMAEEKKYASIYPDLSVGEFRQLCYMAYCGEIQPSDKAATLYRKRFKVDRKKYDETASCLVEKGYLQTKSFVRPEKHLKILIITLGIKLNTPFEILPASDCHLVNRSPV